VAVRVPVVARLEGTNVEEGRRILKESGLDFTLADGMLDAARKVVALAARDEHPGRTGDARRRSGNHGREGSFHARGCLEYGTRIVAGVTPGRGGVLHEGIPVFDTVQEAVAKTGRRRR